MNYTPEEIEKIKEQNKTLKSAFAPWPILFFFLGIYIAGKLFQHVLQHLL